MIKPFRKFARTLFSKTDTILLAVSGGIDSVVLVDLFAECFPNQYSIAHCNFQLRGKESDIDAIFCEELALHYEVSFYLQNFDTQQIAQERKESIQVVARDLRYEWFEQVRQTGYDYIATAHHLNDSIETVFFNFAKGTGIRGLHGIFEKKEQLIRPLIFAKKEQIEAYAEQEELIWREDASNASDKYSRNYIRHHIVPAFKEINHSFEETAKLNIQRLRDTELLFDFALAQIIPDVLEMEKGDYKIHIQKLLSYPAPKTILYEIIGKFGFHSSQFTKLFNALKNGSGKQFWAGNNRLVIDREYLILSPDYQQFKEVFELKNEDTELDLPEGKLIIKTNQEPPTTFDISPNQTYLDLDKLTFPLKVRRWQQGDKFQPLGLKGKHQKLQDFFTYQKLSILDKERAWIIESAGAICVVVARRIDERFKVNPTTKRAIFMEFISN